MLYQKMGDYNKARVEFDKSIKILRNKLGEEHSYLVQVVNNAAVNLIDLGEER